MIGPGETNEMRAACVIARKPHRLHHRFGAGHMERDLVLARDLAQSPDIVGNHRVVGAEHRAERMGAPLGTGNAILVEVVAEYIDAIRAGQIVQHVAVEIGDGNPGRRLHKSTGAEMLADQPAVLKRHPIGLGELQVGDAACELQRHLPAGGKTLPVLRGEQEEAVLAPCRDSLGCTVRAKEFIDIEFVERNQARDEARHSAMAGQRPMLGPRQRQSRLQFRQDRRGAGDRGGGQ